MMDLILFHDDEKLGKGMEEKIGKGNEVVLLF